MQTETPTVGHPFERAGLGLAPFRFVSMTESVHHVCQGVTQPGSSCDYCGTAIRYVCHIESADKRRFKVGTDCVLKLERSDNRLVSAVKRAQQVRDKERRDVKRAAQWAERKARWAAEAEAARPERERLEREAAARREQNRQRSAPVASMLRATGNTWAASIAGEMEEGRHVGTYSERAVYVMRDIVGRHAGRKNSTAYKIKTSEFDDMIASAIAYDHAPLA